MELTDEEKIEIAKELIKDEDPQLLLQAVVGKCANMMSEMNAESMNFETNGTHKGKRLVGKLTIKLGGK